MEIRPIGHETACMLCKGFGGMGLVVYLKRTNSNLAHRLSPLRQAT